MFVKILVITPEAGVFNNPLATAVNRMTESFCHVGSNLLTCTPLYKNCISDLTRFKCIFKGIEKLHHKPFEIWQNEDSKYTYIYNEEFFGRSYIYGEKNAPYADNHIRYSFLASAALMYATSIHFVPQAVLGHEWGGALAGAQMHTVYASEFKDIPFFLTIHNINYDFLVFDSEIEKLGLPHQDYNMDGYEYWGKVSLLKAGVYYAKKVLLPSVGYKELILKSNLAGGLIGFLRRNAAKLKGIQFGVNYNLWDLDILHTLPLAEAKRKAKQELSELMQIDLSSKLLLYANLDSESGNTSETLSTLLADFANLDVFVLVGMNENSENWDYYHSIANQYSHNFNVQSLGSDNKNLKKFLSGADALFASNLSEPSTSILLKALASATIPITGKSTGVADMLSGYTEETEANANAFLVESANSPVLMLASVKKCEEIYKTEKWQNIVENAYHFRYEWNRTISQYLLTFGEE